MVNTTQNPNPNPYPPNQTVENGRCPEQYVLSHLPTLLAVLSDCEVSVTARRDRLMTVTGTVHPVSTDCLSMLPQTGAVSATSTPPALQIAHTIFITAM